MRATVANIFNSYQLRVLITPFLLVVFLVMESGVAYGQQNDGFTATAPATVNVGEQFQYKVEGSERGEVMLPPLAGFQLLAGPFSSYSSTSQWINGKMTMQTLVTYTYVFRATRAGSYTIAPSTITVGRKEMKTNEVNLEVIPEGETSRGKGQGNAAQGGQAQPEGGQSQEQAEGRVSDEEPPVFLRVIPSRREVYVGEQFVSGLKVFTRVNTRPAGASADLAYEGFYKKSVDADATAQRQDINGQQYVTQVIQRHILIPQKSGEITIAPYQSEWMVPQRVQRRTPGNVFDDFFNDPFFDSFQDRQVSLSTLPVTIRVKPLPGGAPEGYGGAVGSFTMTAELSKDEVSENEALSLRVTISGSGNLPLLEEPEVNLPPDHDLYETSRSLNISTSGNRLRGSVTFEYPIVARHAGRFRIPPVNFAWFDPDAGTYRTVTTSEFNFSVLKGEPVESTGPVFIPGVMQENVENIGTDIRDISRDSQEFSPLSYALMGQRIYRWAYAAIAFLALLAIVSLRLVARKNADLTLVKNRRASRMAHSRLKKADRFRRTGEQDEFYEEVGKTIWGYLSDKLSIETSNLSRDAVLDMLQQRGMGEQVRDDFLRILDNSEFSRFAPTSEKSEVNQLFNEASELIKNLENNLK